MPTGTLRPATPVCSAAWAGLLFTLGTAQFATGQAADPDLVLWLSFDRLAGEVFLDASDHGNRAQASGVMRVKGVDQAGVDVSLPGAAIVCDDSPSLNLTTALSLEAWLCPKGPDPGRFATVIRKEAAYALRFEGNRLGLLLWCGGQLYTLATPPLDLQSGTWMHVVATYDGQGSHLYIDGAEVAAGPVALPGPLDAGTAPCCIGSGRGQYTFNGVLDEVRIHARALAPESVREAHQAGRQQLAAQAARALVPEPVGPTPKPFRKPPREVREVVPGFLWVDAEDFEDYGGWVLDTQFVHLMGSAYLLAAGVGTPVADARTRIHVPRAGTYRVWVRARNWVRPQAPGQFLVRLDDRPLPTVLGKADHNAWTWELAGERELGVGPHTLALHDLTGLYGRSDVVLLTTDREYVPPAAVDAVCSERARLCGFSLEPEPVGRFDVIVVGGGPAGVPAALAAARLGARTALIQNRPVLGGNASDECGVPLNGAASQHPNARETGIAEEVGRLLARHGYRRYSEPFRLLTAAEPNLSVFVNRHVMAVEMASPQRLAAVQAVDTLSGRLSTYRGTFFIDCTGDGWVGYYAKADFRLGREARHEFDEDMAPAEADSLTMSGCLMGNGLGFRAQDTGKPAPFTRPAWAREITRLDGPGRRLRSISSGEWWLEHPNDIDDVWQAEEARDELIKIAFSYWDYIKNRSERQDQARTYAITHIPIIDAKRESRRLLGDIILTQNDCLSGRVFPDRIAYGGWPLDVHHPEGIFSGAAGSFHCNAHVPIYTIPYRCLYSRNLDNLFFAGRCASVTHIALGSIRVESTLATLGQAAGTAAALCHQLGTSPRGLYEQHLGTLQQTLLKHDQTIPGIVNEDPADLARGARAVTASSTATFVELADATLSRDTAHDLDHDRGMVLATGALERLTSLSLYLGNTTPAPIPVTLRLFPATGLEDRSATTALATVTATVPAGRESWVPFEVDCRVTTPLVWFWIPRTPGLTWRLMTALPPDSGRLYGAAASGHWVLRREAYAVRCEPPLRVAAAFAPDHVISGVARTWGGASHLWASDPRQDLPQWVALEFARPITINTAYLTFDTNLAPRLPGPGNARETVRDYTLSVRRGETWHEVAAVTGNFQRHNRVRFETTEAEAVRLTVQGTQGDRSARVFEIRLYQE